MKSLFGGKSKDKKSKSLLDDDDQQQQNQGYSVMENFLSSPSKLGGSKKDLTPAKAQATPVEQNHIIVGLWSWGEKWRDVEFKKNGTFVAEDGMIENLTYAEEDANSWFDDDKQPHKPALSGTWIPINGSEVEVTINGTKCKVQDEDDEEDPKPYDTKSVVRLVVDETSLKLQERRYSGPGHEFKPIFIEPIGGYKGLYFVDPKDERLEYLEEDDDTNSNELKDEGLAGHFAIRTEGTYIQLVKQKLDSASYTFRLGEIDNGPAGSTIASVSSLALGMKTVNFRSDDVHQAIYINGKKFGCRGGDMDTSTKFKKGFVIDKLKLGFSRKCCNPEYGRGLLCGFNTMHITKLNDEGKPITKVFLDDKGNPVIFNDKGEPAQLNEDDKPIDTNGKIIEVANKGPKVVDDNNRDVIVDVKFATREDPTDSDKTGQEVAYVYDRDRLGLNINITAVVVQRSKNRSSEWKKTGSKAVPAVYNFTLSAVEGLPFNEEEFKKFWNFLTLARYYEYNYEKVRSLPLNEVEGDDLYEDKDADADVKVAEMEELKKKWIFTNPDEMWTEFPNENDFEESLEEFVRKFSMDKERDALINKFKAASTGTETVPRCDKIEALYDTHRMSQVESGPFYISVDTIEEYDANVQTESDIAKVLMIRGTQFDLDLCNYNTIDFDNAHVLDAVMAVCLTAAINDYELLVEMDFMNDRVKIQAPERAKDIVSFMAIVGARTVAVQQIMTGTDGWDIYSVAANQGEYGKTDWTHLTAAVLCAVIQICGPILLCVYSLRRVDSQEFFGEQFQYVSGNNKSDNDMMVFLRVLFIVYAIAYEGQNIAAGSSELKLCHFLMVLPEFNRKILTAGTVINLIARCLVSFSTILVLYLSLDPTSVILNALALFFVLTVDNELVSDEMLEELSDVQETKLYSLKTKHIIGILEGEPTHQDIIVTHWHFPAWVPTYMGYLNVCVLAIGGCCFVGAALNTTHLTWEDME